MLGRFPFPGTGGEKGGPGIMESLKAIGDVADLLTSIRDELRQLNANLSRFAPKEIEHVDDGPRTP